MSIFTSSQWVNWQPLQIPGEKKPRKVPYDGLTPVTFTETPNPVPDKPDVIHVHGGINHLNPVNWSDYETVAERSKYTGFVFGADDDYFVVDIDYALEADNTWSALSVSICEQFPGAYVEVSHTGNGLHIIAQGKIPEGFKNKNQALGLEVYDHGRYIAITRNGERGTTEINHQAALNIFLSSYMETTSGSQSAEWSTTERDDWQGPDDDDELIRRMLSARPSADTLFSGKTSLVSLWNNDTASFANTYPDGDGSFDASSVDAAFFSHLAFWCGCNCERMERIARRSGLYRAKWDTHQSYLKEFTIPKAVGFCQNVYKDPRSTVIEAPCAISTNKAPCAPDVDISTDGAGSFDSPVGVSTDETPETPTLFNHGALRMGSYQYLDPDQQLEFFKGCVYIQDSHSILIADGSVVTPEQFKARYSIYVFAFDNSNEQTSKCAWETFLKSHAISFPKVHGTAFRPELRPGTIITLEGRELVNTFYPVSVRSIPGDVTPFLDFLAKLLPDDKDRAIMLAYMAACKQYIGTKFQWCPLLQGAEGNGKSMIMRVVAHAVGNRMSHFPNPNDISNKFNAWIEQKAFIGIEEIKISDRRDAIDALKILITNDRIEVQAKGGNQYSGDNRANFIMCSNHRDAVHKTENDRRYAVFYTAQQSYSDLLSSGMGGDYFPDLYRWLNADGYAMVTNYLETYDIPDHLNPATELHRAPTTSTTAEVIKASVGAVEQEILNAIDENIQGFRGGWISSIALDELLKRSGKANYVNRNKRQAMLETLGYRTVGRFTKDLVNERGRPVIYSQNPGVETINDLMGDYIKDQGYKM
jgi:hypothetical protein